MIKQVQDRSALVVLPPVLLKLFVSWRYHRRVRRMVEQLPVLLDHCVRDRKSVV